MPDLKLTQEVTVITIRVTDDGQQRRQNTTYTGDLTPEEVMGILRETVQGNEVALLNKGLHTAAPGEA